MVTGCAGFIGSHLTERLLQVGHEVVGVDCFTDYYSRKIKEGNLSKALKNKRFTLIEKNLLEMDPSELSEGVDYVFHQAAQAGVRASWGENFKIYTDNNILATQSLLEACKESGIKKLVYGSSSSVYGDVRTFPMKETLTPMPISPYGVSKLAGEHLCYLYWKNYGVPTVSLRYFTVYGPRQRPDMAFQKFVRAIHEGKEITIYGDGNQTRDFTFISDIVLANILASNVGASGEVFNIGGGSRISVNKVIEILEDLTGKKAKVIYQQKQKGDVGDTYADITKAKNVLGYKPEVKIEEGLRRYVDSFSK
jgi:UDP-glucose 4-epimerase